MKQAIINTPLGNIRISGDENGIAEIFVLKDSTTISEIVPDILEPPVVQLQKYFNGSLKTFHLKLNPQGTYFQKKVWKALLEIPYGTTTSYLSLSKKLGAPKAVRAVAAANGKNPLWIVIPCHRVIGSDGSLTGYAGGLWRKKWLLELETPTSQQKLF